MSMTRTSKSAIPSDLGSLLMTVSLAMSDDHAHVSCFIHSINLLAERIFRNSIEATDCSTLLIS